MSSHQCQSATSLNKLIDSLIIQVSCTGPEFKYRLVRLIQGHTGPNAPPHREEDMGVKGTSPGRYQEGHPGSYGIVSSWGASTVLPNDGLEVSTYVEPHLHSAGHLQVLVSTLDVEKKSGFAILLDDESKVEVLVGNGKTVERIETDVGLRLRRWAKIEVKLLGKDVEIKINHINVFLEKAPSPSSISKSLSRSAVLNQQSPLLFAAGFFKDQTNLSTRPTSFFNGRLDSPTLKVIGKSARTLASYDFSIEIPTDQIFDASPANRHGVLVNAPTRAIKGWNWDSSEPDWTKAKQGYGAIHFHEDDLDDAGWETCFSITIPEDALSGAYAVEVTDVESSSLDAITFFVRPSIKPVVEASSKPKARAAIILSTFTYLAYANEHMYDESKPTHMEVAGGVHVLEDENWRRMARRGDLGLSMYDAHRDLSGSTFSTAKRPILNVRPGYVHWGIHRPREFSADLLMIGFLEEKLGRGGYDVLTDHDLHLKGVAAIEKYDVVMTGCHPEYPSLESLNAYASFAAMGGSIMYLGGNGFYVSLPATFSQIWMSPLGTDNFNIVDICHRSRTPSSSGSPQRRPRMQIILPASRRAHPLSQRRARRSVARPGPHSKLAVRNRQLCLRNQSRCAIQDYRGRTHRGLQVAVGGHLEGGPGLDRREGIWRRRVGR